jgi:NADPH:quinone reductase-like Zn-dependent oxidoreductase
MKAFVVDKYKKQGPLRLAELPEPQVGNADVLVRVLAASVNPLEAKLRDGAFRALLPYRMPFVLGHDVAGTVVKVGSQVKRFKEGDEVYSRPRDHRIGTFAEFIAINEADVALKPKNLSMEEAAAIPLVALTAWQALVERGKVKPGQKVFIQAGSGGVGLIAIQLAKHLGAAVATTTSAKNIDLVKSLGVDVVIDYSAQDFEKVLSDYDMVLNSQDSKALNKSLTVLKPGGQIISISGPPDADFAEAAGLNAFLKLVFAVLSRAIRKKAEKLGLRYSFLFMRAEGQQLTEITKLIEAGIIKSVLDKVFPFEKTGEALAYIETGRARGKVVIKIAG